MSPIGSVTPQPVALRQRLVWTGGAVVGLWVAGQVPLPFVDPEAVAAVVRPTSLPVRPLFSITALGVASFLSAFVLVELVALLVPGLRRRRLSDPSLRQRLNRWSLTVGLALTLVQGWTTAVYLESLDASPAGGWLSGAELVANPGILFRIGMALTFAAGSLLYVGAAQVITERGVGAGFPVVLLAAMVPEIPGDAARVWQGLSSGMVEPGGVVGACGLLAFVAWGSWRLLVRGGRPAGPVGLKLPVCGSAPLELSAYVPAFLVSFANVVPGGAGELFGRVVTAVAPGRAANLVVAIAIIAVATPVFATLFYWRRRARLREPPARAEWGRAMLRSGAFLAGLAIASHFVSQLGGVAASSLPSVFTLLFVVAVVSDFVGELRYRRRLTGDAVRLSVYHDVADVLEDTDGLDVVIQGLHVRGLGYVFLPYVPLAVLAPEERA